MKLPKESSFAWLCGFIGTLHACVNILAQGKLDVNECVDFTIPTEGWGTEDEKTSVPGYPYYIDIAAVGVLDSDVVAVDVAPVSKNAAEAANFTNTQSYAGKFRLRAESIPTAEIAAQYHITNTADYEEA